MFDIENRLLQELSLYMVAKGYGAIAKATIDPIIVYTAEKKKKMATINNPKIISDVEFILKKYNDDAEYRFARHLERNNKKSRG